MRGFFMIKKSAEPKKKKSQPSAHFWKASCVRKQGSVNIAFLSSHTSIWMRRRARHLSAAGARQRTPSEKAVGRSWEG